MKIQVDENNFVTGYALEGSLGEDEIVISDQYIEDENLMTNIMAYKYIDNKLVLDKNRLSELQNEDSLKDELKDIEEKLYEFKLLSDKHEEEILYIGKSDIDIESERNKISSLYKRKLEIIELLNA